jgi:hypothetical protein
LAAADDPGFAGAAESADQADPTVRAATIAATDPISIFMSVCSY